MIKKSLYLIIFIITIVFFIINNNTNTINIKYENLKVIESRNNINIEETKKFFSDLADESNYPMVFHCSIGTDRTGYLAYLIGGLLGVPQEELYRDYLYSNFGEIGDFRTLYNVKYYYMDPIDKYPGETLSEKVESYLLEIGVPQSDIDAIRNILLEK